MAKYQMLSEATTGISTDLGATLYQLLHVDTVRPQLASHLDPEAFLCFKKLPSVNQQVDNAKLIRQPISMQFATLFVPGSIWSADGKLVAERSNAAYDYRTIVLEKRLPRPRRLTHFFPIGTAQPSVLTGASPASWYVVLRNGPEFVIIPCFELLRAFYYYSADGLINYFFSRLALDTLCWPIDAPNKSNDFTAHFGVASILQRLQEARVLAELLFNSHYRRTIQLAHAELALAWHTCLTERRAPEAHVKVRFSLGHPVPVQAYGTSFLVGPQAYFLINRLVPPSDWYCFDKVVYHPLAEQPIKPHHSPFRLPKLAFRDVLEGQRSTPIVTPVPDLPDTFRAFGKGNKSTLFSQVAHPPVAKAFAWAERVAPSLLPDFAEADTRYFPWGRSEYSPPNKEPLLPYNLVFYSILAHMHKLGCFARIMEVNNFRHQFGIGRSLLPYSQEPTTTTHLPDYRQRPVSIAAIMYGGAYFNILNILDNHDVVLIYREDLATWENDDYERLLSTMILGEFDWKYTENMLTTLTGKAHSIIVKELKYIEEDTIESVAYGYYKIIRKFIRHYNFIVYAERLKIDCKINKLDAFEYYFQDIKVFSDANKKDYSSDYIGEPPFDGNVSLIE